MGGRLILLGLVLGAIALALTVLSDPGRLNRVRVQMGFEPLRDWGVAELEPEAVAAEIERIEALPLTAAEGDDPVTVGRFADSARACLEQERTLVRSPKQRAEAGLRRYLVALGATAAAPETPLLAPQFRPLGAIAAREGAAAEGLTAEEKALLAAFHDHHSSVNNPLYRGLELYENSFEALDFEALAAELAQKAPRVAACAAAHLWPPQAPEAPEAPEATEVSADSGTDGLEAPVEGQAVVWACDGAEVRVTVLATDPPGLLLERDGATGIGAQVPSASGVRYEGDFGAWVSEGAEARLERPDGSVAACAVAGG